jgi:hypothetical protein
LVDSVSLRRVRSSGSADLDAREANVTWSWLAGALLVGGMSAAPANADRSPVPSAAPALTIRVYAADQDDLPGSAAIELTAALLARAGVPVRALACGGRRADQGCTAPMTATDLAVRLLRQRRGTAGSFIARPHDIGAEGGPGAGLTPGGQAMGSSLIDTTHRTGSLATLYLDRVEALASSSGVSAAVVLARALAHEVAHLVLGTNEHGTSGLMRPLWSRAMLRTDAEDRWVFTAEEGTRMRAALGARFAGVSRPHPQNASN